MLLAGMQGGERARADAKLLSPVAIEATLKAIKQGQGRARAEYDAEAGSDLDQLGDRPDPDPSDAALGDHASRSVLDRAYLIRIGCAFHPTAPPSHRPCAAPPTGPPLA